MRRAALVLFAFGLAACAHKPVQLVVVHPVAVRVVPAPVAAVPVPNIILRPAAPERACPALPPTPAFPDTDSALAKADGLEEKYQRLMDGREARIKYRQQIVTAYKECAR